MTTLCGRLLLAFVAALAAAMPSSAGGAGPSRLAAAVASFNLGQIEIPQPGTGRFAVYPTELKGVIGVPSGSGPRPIVVLMHGRHGTGCPEMNDLDTWPCPAQERRHDLGFRYLVSALAQRGFVALSINVNAADTNGWGEPRENRTAQILREFLVRLATANGGGANGFGVPLAGRIDFARLGLVGHSQRGARAVEIARARATSPGPVAAGRGRIRALLLLAPVLRPGSVPSGTAFGLVLPQCDSDVVDLGGLAYFDRAGRERRARPAALVYLAARTTTSSTRRSRTRAAAAGASAGRARSGSREPPRPPGWRATRRCSSARRSPEAGLRAANLDPAAPPRRLVFGRRVLTSILVPRTNRLALRTAIGSAGATVETCRKGRSCAPGLWQPTYPKQLLVAWSRRGEMVTSSFAAPRDVREFDAVRLQVAVDPTDHSNPRWRPQAFSLVLRDAGGRSAAARVRRAAPALGFPPGRFGPGTKRLSYVITSDLRVPLGAFRGVNLRRLVSTSLRFDRTRRGSILLANLELVRASQLR